MTDRMGGSRVRGLIGQCGSKHNNSSRQRQKTASKQQGTQSTYGLLPATQTLPDPSKDVRAEALDDTTMRISLHRRRQLT
eukprot:scaffold18357_cov62-Cyclotella_meneghiniana.AAC.3